LNFRTINQTTHTYIVCATHLLESRKFYTQKSLNYLFFQILVAQMIKELQKTTSDTTCPRKALHLFEYLLALPRLQSRSRGSAVNRVNG